MSVLEKRERGRGGERPHWLGNFELMQWWGWSGLEPEDSVWVCPLEGRVRGRSWDAGHRAPVWNSVVSTSRPNAYSGTN